MPVAVARRALSSFLFFWVGVAAAGGAEPAAVERWFATLADPAARPTARLEAADQLVGLEDSAVNGRLMELIRGPHPVAAGVLAEHFAGYPRELTDGWLAALPELLGSERAVDRRWAAIALARDPANDGLKRLQQFVGDPEQPAGLRIEALRAAGAVIRQPVVGFVGRFALTAEGPLRASAFEVLEEASGGALRAAVLSQAADETADELIASWLESLEAMPAERWVAWRAQRLALVQAELRRAAVGLEDRLTATLRTLYQRVGAEDRSELLAQWLGDSQPAVRAVALELLLNTIVAGAEVPAGLRARARELLGDDSPAVQGAAARAVAAFRDGADEGPLLSLFEQAVAPDVRKAVATALGYVGSAAAVEPLLQSVTGGRRLLERDSARLEALTALGRLIERGALAEPQRATVRTALSGLAAGAAGGDAGVRERALWALTQLRDPVLQPLFAAATAEENAPAVRLSALRGLNVLDEAGAIDAGLPLLAASDVALRRTAVEAVGRWATTDTHFAALAERVASEHESDDAVRKLAWSALRDALSRGDAEQQQRVADRLGAADSPLAPRQQAELYRLAAESLAAADQPAAAAAAQEAQAERLLGAELFPEALAAYRAALLKLHPHDGAQAAGLAARLIALSVRHDEYTPELVERLRSLNTPLDGARLLAGLRLEIERLRASGAGEQAAVLLAALRAQPPIVWSPEQAAALEALRPPAPVDRDEAAEAPAEAAAAAD